MPPPYDAAALQRLATAVIQRRVDLGHNKIDVARAAELQINTYSKIEDAKPVRLTTYGKVEAVLGWAPGSCIHILDGAAAATLIERDEAGTISPVRAEDLAKDVGDAVQNAAIAVGDDLSAAQIRALKQRAVEEVMQRWKERGIEQD
ncbi:hypothetical protein [Streptomyces sp.]|uniref:hypothetical protein n=1 Tax=Streptomyces sp. TaxID=1931 RepID=UPI0028110D8C|nr:hypothetical protein [Streptomyces sp.]